MVDDDVVTWSLTEIISQMQSGRPAALSTHRRNYVSFAGDVPRNLALLDEMLASIQREIPDAAYLTSDEVRQLWETGTSVRTYGTTAVLRNWTDDSARPRTVELPARYRVSAIETARSWAEDSTIATDDGRRVLIMPGNYRATIELVAI